MKVLLFTARSGERPKCVSRSVGFDPAEILQGQKWLADSGFCVWWTAHEKAINADAWWLVECANAEAGRRVIAHHGVTTTCDCEPRFDPSEGSVLAHGGKSAGRAS